MKYVASFAVGIAAAILAAMVYVFLSPEITVVELGWGGYWSVEAGVLPRFLLVLLATFTLGFFWSLRRRFR